MDFEPLAKRRRTLSPELGQRHGGDPYPAQFLEEPKEDDEAYKTYLERAFADPRFRDTVAKIFDKFGQKDANGAAAATDGPSTNGEPIDPALSSLMIDHGMNELLDTAVADVGLEETTNGALELFQRHQAQDSMPDDATVSTELDIPDSKLQRQFSGAPSGITAQSNNFYAQNFGQGLPPYDPRLGFMPAWYGPLPQAWEGQPMPFGMPIPANGQWGTPNGFMFAPGPWPQMFSANPPLSTPADGQLPVQQPEEEKRAASPTPDDKTPMMAPPPPPTKPGKGPHPRLSKNGKRLGRPPKGSEPAENVSSTLPKEMNDIAAYDGEGEDNGAARPQRSPKKAVENGELEDDDSDLLWEDVAAAMGQCAATVNLVGKTGAILSRKRRNELKGNLEDTETDTEVVEKELELRMLYKQLISCKSQDSTDDQTEEGEGRRRSGRERKRVDFPDKVSWRKFCAERRYRHKITMVLRALAVKDRQQNKQQQSEAAAVKDEQANAADGKPEPATTTSAHESTTAEGNQRAPKSTIPDSQESVITLPIRSPEKAKAYSEANSATKNDSAGQSKGNDEEFLFSDDEAPAFLPKKSLPKPQFPADASPKLGGATFFETVYALSDDECPALLQTAKLKPQAEPAPAPARDAASEPELGLEPRPEPGPEPGQEKIERAAPLPAETEKDVTDKRPAKRAPLMNAWRRSEPENETQAIMEQLEVMDVDFESADEIPTLVHGSDATVRRKAAITATESWDDSGIDIAGEQTAAANREQESFAGAVDALTGDIDMTDDSNLLDSFDPATDTAATSLPSDDGKWDEEAPLPANSPADSPSLPPPITFATSEPPEDEHLADVKGLSPAVSVGRDRKEAQPDNLRQSEPGRTCNSPEQQQAVEVLQEEAIPSEDEAEPVTLVISSTPERPVKEKPNVVRKTPPIAKLFVSPPRRSSLPLVPSKASTKQPDFTRVTPATTKKADSERSKLPASASRTSSVSRSSSKNHAPRRSLLSLVGEDDDLEDLGHEAKSKPKLKRKSYPDRHPTYRPGQLVSTLSSMSKSAAADRHASGSKERRRKEKEKRRHSSIHETSTSSKRKSRERETKKEKTSSGPKGTCGVDGYTCGRDFCFTCL